MMGVEEQMSDPFGQPSIDTKEAANNLGPIMQYAGSQIVESERKLVSMEDGQRRENAAQYDAMKNGGSTEAGLYGDIAVEAIGGGVGALLKVAKDTLTVADDRGWFDGGHKEAFPLNDRVKNVSKFFSGASDADDQKFLPKTAGIEGKQQYQEVTVSRMLHKQRYDQALALSHQIHMTHQGPRIGMGGPGMNHLSPNMMMSPKAPNFGQQLEEQPTNWGAGTVTG